MGTYAFLLGSVVLGNVFQRRRSMLFLNILLLTVLFVYCAFRGEYIGIDTPTYLSIYEFDSLLDNYKNEYLFYAIVSWVRQAGGSAQGCQVIMAALTYIPLMFLFIKKSNNAALSILIFMVAVNGYYLETYNIVRQSVATPYLLWAYVMASEKKWLNAILFFVIAIGFHTSSLIYLPLFLVALYCKFSYKLVIVGVMVSLFFAFVISNISFLTNIVYSLQNIDLLGFGRYSHFADYRLDMARNVNGLITLLLPHSFLCLYAYKRNKDNLLLRLYFCGVVLLNMLSVMPTSYRMAYGLTALELLIYPIAFKSAGRWRLAFVFLFSILSIYWMMRLNSGGVDNSLVPYKFM